MSHKRTEKSKPQNQGVIHMINLQHLNIKTFLSDYWQKKPLVLRQAMPQFTHPLSADELAGLALEDEFESRIVLETPTKAPYWQLKRGPFTTGDFNKLPTSHWTLLVQGVDRLIPGVASLLDQFNFIPQWRVDDVMISYAVKHGSVGPHYDNYDVFLYQAVGQRRWSLTTQNCHPVNTLENVELRIMKEFHVEEEYILEPGDMLYLPPHVGHHGVSLSDDCMTYSFGYRSYQSPEIWNSLGDYLSEHDEFTKLYRDPNWNHSQGPSEIPAEAIAQAKDLMQSLLNNDELLKKWFGCFVTTLDNHAEQLLPMPLVDKNLLDSQSFIAQLQESQGLLREAICRFAYQKLNTGIQLFINGCEWEVEVGVNPELIKLIANHRILSKQKLIECIKSKADETFLYDLWRLQWLQNI